MGEEVARPAVRHRAGGAVVGQGMGGCLHLEILVVERGNDASREEREREEDEHRRGQRVPGHERGLVRCAQERQSSHQDETERDGTGARIDAHDTQGDQDESLRSADKVLDLNPLDPDSYANKVGALLDARRYTEAVAFAEETKRKSPDLFTDPLLLGICLVMVGRLKDAQEQFAKGKPEQWERLAGEAIAFARAGDKAAVEQKVQRMQQIFGDAASYQYSEIFAQTGDRQRALAALDSAWAIRDGGLINIRVDPFLDPIRNEPRFQAIVKRMNFPA